MRPTSPPTAPSTDDQIVVRVHLTVSDAEVDATVIVQRPRTRRHPTAIASRLPEQVASAVIGALVEHLAAVLATML
jgi:hypothetical protein